MKTAIDKYLGLAAPFCDIRKVEIKDAGSRDIGRALTKEGADIMKTSSRFVLLHESGTQQTSVEFADFLGKSNRWDFVIGGPYGVSKEVLNGAAYTLSLSKMTFTHEMSRIILLEQIYRALTIMNKRGYHH